MNRTVTERGFGLITHPKYPSGVESRLIQESSVIRDYDDAFSRAGSSCLWIGEDHHLGREEVAELIGYLQEWLDNRTIRPPKEEGGATQYCPLAIAQGRGPDSPFKPPMNGEMVWSEDDTCSWCGSLHPGAFMERLEAGSITLVPTDKDYKVSIINSGGALFRQAVRICPSGATCSGPDDCTHWTIKEVDHAKLYFHHLSMDQRRRFVELLNEKRVSFDYPGHFYRRPFFIGTETNPAR